MTVLEEEEGNNCEGIKSHLESETKFKEVCKFGMRKNKAGFNSSDKLLEVEHLEASAFFRDLNFLSIWIAYKVIPIH